MIISDNSFEMDSRKIALGIPRLYFVSPFEAIVSSSTSYIDDPIHTLLKYEPNGKYYYYEDDFVSFRNPTTPTETSSVMVRFKPKKFAENDIAIMYLTNSLSRTEIFNSVSFMYVPFASQEVIIGVIMNISELSTIVSSNQHFVPGETFMVPENFVFMNEVNYDNLFSFFKKMTSRSQKWLSIKFNKSDKENISEIYGV